MGKALDEVLKAVATLGHAHARFRHVLEDTERRVRELQDTWLREIDELAVEILDADEDINEYELEKSLGDFLLDGDVEKLDVAIPDDVLAELQEARADYEPELREAHRPLPLAEADLTEPHELMVAQLRAWLDAVRAEEDAAVDDWAEILKAWRTATDRTTREAASDLDMSPSAIVRYEQRKRTPSPPYIAAMIDRIATCPVGQIDSPFRQAARDLARTFDMTATEILESVAGPEPTPIDEETQGLRDEIEARLDTLDERDLRVISTLVRDGQAMAALYDWLDTYSGDPLKPLADALTAAGVGGQAKRRQGPS